MLDNTSGLGIEDRGEQLVQQRAALERGEAGWLESLAAFDRDQGYRVDGHLSCVTWLTYRTGMSRGTAFEKLRIGHELRRRPAVAAAYKAAAISYSAVRAITRLDRPDPEVDQALVDLATAGSVHDLERAVRHYQLCAEQDQAPDQARLARRGIKLRRSWDGLGTADITLDAIELDEFDAALNAFMDHQPVDNSSPEDAIGDDPTPPWDRVVPWKRKADALMELVRTALAHLGERFALGVDRYMVHIVTDTDRRRAEHIDGTPLHPAEAARVTCDATTITHHHDHHGDPLHQGRRTRVWNTAQRRAITIHDGGFCRYPGCDRTICDVHHLQPWSAGGPTDTENGLLLCTRHHTLIHEGFTATGDANHHVTFHRPNGTPIATTTPLHRFGHNHPAGVDTPVG